MKAIVIMLTISFVAVLDALTDEQKAKLKEHKASCITETGVDPILLENRKKGEATEDDEKLACFATCMLKKIGIITADEEIDWEVAHAKTLSSLTQEEADQIQNACKDITGTGCTKGHNLFKCFAQNKFIIH